MKAFIFTFFAMLFLAAGASARDVTVRLGQEQKVPGNIKIGFISVIDDSRCPANVTCVWAGNAKIKISVSRSGSKRTFELSTMLNPRSVNVFGYEIELTGVDPYPGLPAKTADDKNNKTSPTATFKITKM